MIFDNDYVLRVFVVTEGITFHFKFWEPEKDKEGNLLFLATPELIDTFGIEKVIDNIFYLFKKAIARLQNAAFNPLQQATGTSLESSTPSNP